MNPLHNGHYLPADNRPRSAGVTPAVVGLMLVSEAILDTLLTIAPPEADERAKAEAIMEQLAKWSAEHHDPSIGTWRVHE